MTEQEDKRTDKNNSGMSKKVFKFLKGMPFSFILLGLMIAACVLGSVISQGKAVYYYMESYGASKGGLIVGLGIDHIFTSVWFLVITGLLCLNLILCSVSRIKSVIAVFKRTKSFGIWGSWLVHFGLLLLIISFVGGQILAKEEVVYGIAGSTQDLGKTGLKLTIDSFEAKLRDDYTVEQYIAGLTITDEKGDFLSGEASVNHPFKAFGYNFYQDSMGWASYVDIYKDKEYQATDLICAGEYTSPSDMPSLILMFRAFYPDFEQREDGSIYTKTPLLKDPRMLYSVYFDGNLISMNVAKPGELITANNYGFVMRDPVEYTLIVARRDPLAWAAGVSALIMLIGLFLSFYVRPWEEKRRKENG